MASPAADRCRQIPQLPVDPGRDGASIRAAITAEDVGGRRTCGHATSGASDGDGDLGHEGSRTASEDEAPMLASLTTAAPEVDPRARGRPTSGRPAPQSCSCRTGSSQSSCSRPSGRRETPPRAAPSAAPRPSVGADNRWTTARSELPDATTVNMQAHPSESDALRRVWRATTCPIPGRSNSSTTAPASTRIPRSWLRCRGRDSARLG